MFRNQKLEDYKRTLSRERIAVLGLGISNAALLRFLSESGARNVVGFDKNDNEYVRKAAAEFTGNGWVTRTVLGENYLDEMEKGNFTLIFKSPVIRPDLPQLERAVRNGARLTGEMELFMELCPCKMIAVTGSDGKTTTTTLVSKLLEQHYRNSGIKIWLGGNIGHPLIAELGEIVPEDRVVLELSSFQLMTMRVSPHVAVITNITPNHLDVHKSYGEYTEAKCQIFRNRTDCRVVLNAKNACTAQIAENLYKEGQTPDLFSAHLAGTDFPAYGGAKAFLRDDSIVLEASDGVFSMKRADLLLPGVHNAENLMAAVCACRDEVTRADILEIARTFGGVEHRLELVRVLNGVPYYNSSIDSSPNRTINALSVFSGNIVLIAGGKDKNIPYDDLGPVLAEKVKTLILTGPTAEKIENALKATGKEKRVKVFRCQTYEEAVRIAHEEAVPGDTVLLSPASTSFDMFRNFEERGNYFKTLVLSLLS